MLSSILQPAIQFLENLATVVPLPWFVVIGSFIEELIAPIPSPLVMTLAGSLVGTEHGTVAYLVFLALIGAASKTFGSYLIYVISDRAEDIVTNKIGKLIGITHKEVEAFGKHLNQGWKDDIIMFLLRAIPIIPTAPVSVVAGLIKVNLPSYLVATFLGTAVRSFFYLYLGYSSIGFLESINEGLDSWEKVGYLILFILLAVGLGYAYYRREKDGGSALLDKFFSSKEK